MAQPKITAPDVDQPLQGVQEKDVPIPRRAEEIGDEQARAANLALTMQYGGLEHTIPLRLPNEDIGKLALEAELREISLGQLVGMLIEAAMAQDLSRVLDKKPAEEPEQKTLNRGPHTEVERDPDLQDQHEVQSLKPQRQGMGDADRAEVLKR
jgi:hypothetical protein